MKFLGIFLIVVFVFSACEGDLSNDDLGMGIKDELEVSEEADLNLEKFGVEAIPDAVVVEDAGYKFVLLDPSEEYGHGALGDKIEAKALGIIKGEELRKINFGEKVFEGLFPVIVDLDGDGVKEIVTTLSDAEVGAQIVVYNLEGDVIASSDSIGTGFRWRHVLTAANFGPEGEIELVDVLTPHLKKEVEYFHMEDGTLNKVASIDGYTTHEIGSRDLSLFGVLDTEEGVLLIIPTSDLKGVAALKRTDDGVEEIWRKEIGEKVLDIEVLGEKLYVNSVELTLDFLN